MLLERVVADINIEYQRLCHHIPSDGASIVKSQYSNMCYDTVSADTE